MNRTDEQCIGDWVQNQLWSKPIVWSGPNEIQTGCKCNITMIRDNRHNQTATERSLWGAEQ